MAKRKFTADLSTKGINDLKRQLQEYQKSLDYRCKWIAETLAERGVEIAVMQVFGLDAVFTGELIESIHSEYKGKIDGGHSYVIVADSEHAIYVEMGTGIVGAKSPYPGKLPAVYAQGKTIRQTANGKYGWFYQDANGDWWFTEGMPSRPFMYNTSLELMNEILEVVKEAFGN